MHSVSAVDCARQFGCYCFVSPFTLWQKRQWIGSQQQTGYSMRATITTASPLILTALQTYIPLSQSFTLKCQGPLRDAAFLSVVHTMYCAISPSKGTHKISSVCVCTTSSSRSGRGTPLLSISFGRITNVPGGMPDRDSIESFRLLWRVETHYKSDRYNSYTYNWLQCSNEEHIKSNTVYPCAFCRKPENVWYVHMQY